MLIRVIDLETCGVAPPADGIASGVCEIGWCDVRPTMIDLVDRPSGWEVDTHTGNSVPVNPGMLIPPETSAIHHIIDEDVAKAAPWAECLAAVLAEPAAQVLAAHSAKFERQWCTDDLTGGLQWVCTYKCALRLWPEAPSHSNQALRYWRRPAGLDRGIASVAHRAFPDAYVTAFHLRDMLELAPIEDLIKWSSEPALQVRCHIGKWRGTAWREVDDGFLYWVSQRDFDEDVLFTVHHEMERREAERRAQPAAAFDGGEPF